MTQPEQGNIGAWLHQVYQADSEQALNDAYKGWASTYDLDSIRRGARQPAIVSGFAMKYLPERSTTILDAGAGTGSIGELLAVFGFYELTAIDLCNEMLRVAEAKRIYTNLHAMTLGETLNLPTSAFGAVVSAGVFTPGHAGPESFTELTRVTKPGGYLIFSVQEGVYMDGGFKQAMTALETADVWKQIESTEPFHLMSQEFSTAQARVFVFRRL